MSFVYPAECTASASALATSTPTPAAHVTCQNPATMPVNAKNTATLCATVTSFDPDARRMKASWWETSTRPARSGMATENATTQIHAERSSEPTVRNGCTRTMPMPMSPPYIRLFWRIPSCSSPGCRLHAAHCCRSSSTVASHCIALRGTGA